MVYIRLFFTLLLVCTQISFAYEKPQAVSQEVWEDLSPYFLPKNHPIKHKLDKIFRKQSVTKDRKAVLNAGFLNAKSEKFTRIIVSKHFDLRGYVVKMYLDTNTNVNEAERFKDRVIGANAIRACIEEFSLGDVVKAPKKWIYPIPEFPDSGVAPKHFVLIAEDMRPYNPNESLKKWKSKINTRQLDAVYIILDHVGLPDCTYAFNIPFCHGGKLAFLDTEHNGKWPVPFQRIKKYLREDMRDYWIKLYQ